MGRYELVVKMRRNREFYHMSASYKPHDLRTALEHTVTGEVEQRRQILHGAVRMARIRESGRRISELVEIWMAHCLDGRKPLGGRIFE